MKNRIIFLCILFAIAINVQAQDKRTDANIIGHVTCDNEHIPFAAVSVKGTAIGTSTDETGHFQLINLPTGKITLIAQAMSYKPKEVEVEVQYGETIEVKFELEKDALGLNEIVVTGDRNVSSRKNATTIVTVIPPKLFTSSQSMNLSQGLQYASGLRIENNCQNCGFNQVRMNGMEGPYSQILINSRPIFSSLAGIYGLELIPSNMIEKVEVVRGGGSALYGSNAIAGTINVILKDPISNTYEFSTGGSLIGVDKEYGDDITEKYHVNFNGSLVSSDARTGMSMYASHSKRNPFDGNHDGFSEIASINNLTMGTRLFHRFNSKSKINIDFFSIHENRRGGNKFDLPEHESDIAESIEHSINSGAVNYERFINERDKLSIYFSAQNINRSSYYGAKQSLSDYGKTKNFSYSSGLQYNFNFKNSKLILGTEHNGEYLKDYKLGYIDLDNPIINYIDSSVSYNHIQNTIVANQSVSTSSAFGQYEFSYRLLKVSAGFRYDNYAIRSNVDERANNEGSVISPRFTLKYDILENLQFRTSWSQGYRAPQIFDEDLHIESSGSRKVIHLNDPDLDKETSNSFLASIDYNGRIAKGSFDFLVEGFYTILNNPFASEFSEPDSNGIVIYTRINAEKGASVLGLNTELSIIPSENFYFKSGLTVQNSQYEKAQSFNEKNFFRTPNTYGYLNFTYSPTKKLEATLSGVYTGAMLIPYFGSTLPDTDAGILRTTDPFFDFGLKIQHTHKINCAKMQLYAGIKNIFNSYQNDFDSGIDRDPGYVYGPTLPRTIYVGIKIGNNLK